jgi:hypothetical protein
VAWNNNFNAVPGRKNEMFGTGLFYGRFFNDSVNLNQAPGSSLIDGTVATASNCLSTLSSDAAAWATSSAISLP